MPDPRQHAEHRGAIESVLRHIPGFRGYLEKEYRRESDALQRRWMADRLERARQGLNQYSLALTDAGQLDALGACERIRPRLDRLLARLRGGVGGYSGFFDFVQVDEDLLDAVYEHDGLMLGRVEQLAGDMEHLSAPSAGSPPDLAAVQSLVDLLQAELDRREDLLRGVGKEQ